MPAHPPPPADGGGSRWGWTRDWSPDSIAMVEAGLVGAKSLEAFLHPEMAGPPTGFDPQMQLPPVGTPKKDR